MALSDSEHRPRLRSRLRPTFSSHNPDRHLPRRLFGRSASVVLLSPTTCSSSPDDSTKRSFLAKPPTPGATKRIFALLRDQKKGTRRTASQKQPCTAPNQSSHPSHDNNVNATDLSSVNTRRSNPKACRNASDRSSLESSCTGAADDVSHESAILDIVTSDVSDELGTVNKTTQGKHPSSEPVSSQQTDPNCEHTDDLLFIDDINTHSIAFNLVGDEEDTVPEAPTSKIEADCFAAYEERVRTLQTELDTLKAEKQKMDTALQQHSRQQNVLLNSVRTRAEESSAEVEQLSLQLRDTRKRLNRRIRELEANAEVQKTRHAEQIEQHHIVEAQLRAEVDRLRRGAANTRRRTTSAQRLARIDSSPVLTDRGNRASTRTSREGPLNPRLGTNSLSSRGRSGLHPNFSRVQSANNIQEPAFRTLSNPNDYRPRNQTYRNGTFTLMETNNVSSKTLARRSLLRRSFIAHVHSSRYKSVQAAWHDFLGAENSHVTPEQFSRAVRRLAIAADARDRDLELLRKEVSGAEENDTGVVTWEMFKRFYGLTKYESM